MRTKVSLAPGLCALHKSERRRQIALVWVLFLVGLAMLVTAKIVNVVGMLVLPVAFLLLFGAVVLALRARLVWIKEVTPRVVRLGGCGGAFLESLPPWSSTSG